MGTQQFNVILQKQELIQDASGYNIWQKVQENKCLPAGKTAVLICDMWDDHWARGAAERVNVMAPRMNEVIKACRENGALIIHAPSDTMKFYDGTPSRRRITDAPRVYVPVVTEHPDFPLPIDDSDGGSDTGDMEDDYKWTRQHPSLEIDHERDVISEDGLEIYNYIRQKGIQNILIMGVHTNFCILGRSFGIKQMVKWGLNVILVSDLTDSLYNPVMPPYVSHDEGTRLVVEYIEKFWCPSTLSKYFL